MSINFGFCVPIFAMPGPHFFRTPSSINLSPRETLQSAIGAEKAGYDSIWVADHLMLGKDQAILEGWTTLSVIAGATERVQLGLIHQANLFRHPALTAKMSASLDQLSAGRFIYFCDPGSASAEHLAYGLPWQEDRSDRIAAFTESLEIITSLWQSDSPYSFAGNHYNVKDAVSNPKPVQQPHPPIWMGSTEPSMHTLCARFAQGWNTTPISLEKLKLRLDELEAACQRENTSFDTLEKSLEVQILIGDDLNAVREKLLHVISLDAELIPISDSLQAFLSTETDQIPEEMADTWLIGTPDMIIEQVNNYISHGISHFLLWFIDWPNEDGLIKFTDEVMPRFK